MRICGTLLTVRPVCPMSTTVPSSATPVLASCEDMRRILRMGAEDEEQDDGDDEGWG